MRKPIIFGNWKMNMTWRTGLELVSGLTKELAGYDKADVGILPPFVYLHGLAEAARGTQVKVGAQNMYFEESGAFTGEIAPGQVKDAGAEWVLLGHSERRHVFGETDALINKKLHAAFAAGLKPIFAVGELLAEREAGRTEEVVRRQLVEGMKGLSKDQATNVVIAYEPVWAIGTGKTATPDQAQEVHAYIRKLLAGMYDAAAAETIRIQYGGSMKADNAKALIGDCPDVDGGLIGGAALKLDSFLGIVKFGG